ncbi:rim15, signal transduction response regulator [Tilletia horrida]|nr:rim15, signal transduction response regulator [Tilletia horrida]
MSQPQRKPDDSPSGTPPKPSSMNQQRSLQRQLSQKRREQELASSSANSRHSPTSSISSSSNNSSNTGPSSVSLPHSVDHAGSLGSTARKVSVGMPSSLSQFFGPPNQPAPTGHTHHTAASPTPSSASGGSSHRRSRSLGGVLLGTDALASPIGGPDGVDPNLVAAISASGQDIPGIPLHKSSGAEHRVHPIAIVGHSPAHPHLSQQGSGAHSSSHHHYHHPESFGLSSSPSVIGSPSPASSMVGSGNLGTSATTTAPTSASGSTSHRKLNRKPSELLSVMPDTRALANTYPSMAMPTPRSGSGSSGSPAESLTSSAQIHGDAASVGSHSVSSSPAMTRASIVGHYDGQYHSHPHVPAQPTPVIGGPAAYSRSRVRSQTMAPRITSQIGHESVGGAARDAPGDTSASSLSASLGASAGAGMAAAAAAASAAGGPPPGPRSQAQFPLADAIRLQRVPTAVRLAGDLFLPSSPVARRGGGPFSGSSDVFNMATPSGPGPAAAPLPNPNAAANPGPAPHASIPISSHGLGIGLSAERLSRHQSVTAGSSSGGSAASAALPIPQTPSTTRSPSPAYPSDNPYSASQSSASGRNSPVQSLSRSVRDRMSGSFVVPPGFTLGAGFSSGPGSGTAGSETESYGGGANTSGRMGSPGRSGVKSASASRRVSGIMTGAPPSPTSRRVEPHSGRGSASAFSPLLSLSTGHMPVMGPGLAGAVPAPSPVLGPTPGGRLDLGEGALSGRREHAHGQGASIKSPPSTKSSQAESDAESMPPPPRPTSSTIPPTTALDSATQRSGPAPWIASSREVPAKVTRSPTTKSRPSSSHGGESSFSGSGGFLFSRTHSSMGTDLTAPPVPTAGPVVGGSSGKLPVSTGVPTTPSLRSAETGHVGGRRPAALSTSRPRSGAGAPITPAGTDEYSRIIVQSRNAKVQRWKTARQTMSNVAQAQALFRDPSSSTSPGLGGSSGGERTPMQRMDSTDSPSQLLAFGARPVVAGNIADAAAGLNVPVHSDSPGASAGLGMGVIPAHTGSIGASGYKTHSLERRGTIIGLVARDHEASMMQTSDSLESFGTPAAPIGARPTGGSGADASVSRDAEVSYSYYDSTPLNVDESGAGAREIEWVDWLDEYRKMKEAKLRSEQAEAESEAEHEHDHETESEFAPGTRRGSLTGTEVESVTASERPLRKLTAESESRVESEAGDAPGPAPSEDDQEVLSTLADDGRRQEVTNRSNSEGQLGPRQRPEYLAEGYRPSPGASQEPSDQQRRAVSAGVVGPDKTRYGALATSSSSSPGKRLAPLQAEKQPRMVSLSPIPTRITSTSTQASSSTGTNTNVATGSTGYVSARRRRNLLGTKIENWWNAVKTGFAPPDPPLRTRPAFGLGHRSPPIGSSNEMSVGAGSQSSTSAQKAASPQVTPSSSHQRSAARGSQKDSATGLSSSNAIPRPPPSRQVSQASSRADIAESAKSGASGRKGSLTSNDEVTPSPSSLGPTGTSVEPESSDASSRCSEETTGRDVGRKRHPYLSLDLDKNISSFSSSAFESMESSSHLDSSVFVPNSPRVPSPLAGVVSTSADTSPKQTFDAGRARATAAVRKGETPSPKSLSRPTTAEQPTAGPSESVAPLTTTATAASSPAETRTKSVPNVPEHRHKDEETKVSSKEITINSIRQHIRHRLAVSKESCDKELLKVIGAVSQFVEDRVAASHEVPEDEDEEDGDVVEEVFIDETDTESAIDSSTHTTAHPGDERDRRSNLSRGQSMSSTGGGGHMLSGMDSVFGDLDDLVDPDETPQPVETALEAPTPRRAVEMTAGMALPLHEGRAHPPSPLRGSIRRSSKSGGPVMPLARHKSLRHYSRSASTSRSTSRSHSPLPAGLSQTSAPSESPRLSPVRKLRPLPVEDAPMDPFIPALQDLVTVAMEVLDTPIQSLTARPGACSEIISHIQLIGQTWDENPDWPGRSWYVQLLLAVAGLSRVVEWWEAEKGFWNFDDENDQADAEPLNFILGTHHTEAMEMQDTRSSQSNAATSVMGSPARNMSVSGPRRPGGSSSPTPDALARRTVSESDSSRIMAAQHTDGDVSSQALEPVEEAPALLGKEAVNVLMELSLDGRFIYLSPAWTAVVGTDPSELYDQLVSDWLAPGDSEIFAEATRQLQMDEAHTVEVTFRLRIDPSLATTLGEDRDPNASYFQEMEGKGMLMQDRETRQSTHVMWVFKPTALPELEEDLQGDGAVKGAKQLDDKAAARVASAATISVEPLLCRICEREIPTWFFESHSEICNEIHRLEMEIAEINESLAELRRTIKGISSALVEETQPPGQTIEFRGIPLTTPPPSSHPPSALEGLNKSVAPKQVNHMAVRKAHLRAIDGMLQMLQTAKDISTPAIKEETAAEPIERQRLLTPTSESKMVQVHQWRPPRLDDAAIDSMIAEVESAVRAKLSGVNRMRNTIVYVERVRQEWEDRVDNALQMAQQGSDSGSSETASSEEHEEVLADVEEEGPEQEESGEVSVGDQSADSQARGNAASSLLQEPQEEKGTPDDSTSGSTTDQSLIPPANISPTTLPAPLPPAVASATPGISSDTSMQRSRRASHMPGTSGETSPHHGPSDGRSSASARRPSTTHRSPHFSAMPLSPRLPPSAPSSRPTASSIRDFEVIKPISKGAFGSVFLAKKKTTGDYFAIKVLKKSDMIAKNQITNVKAERSILMGQTTSPFVVKLYFTFQSQDFLYLVMEYLPGGDCASLCKNLGCLSEEWARQYIAEVVNGLEQLHEKGVVHRDMKPDNLLIDQRGHLKLTDFGLSKIGLLGRQTQTVGAQTMGHSKSDSAASSNPPSSSRSDLGNPSANPQKLNRSEGLSDFGTSPLATTPGSANIFRAQTFFAPAQRGRIVSSSTDVSDSSGSEGPSSLLRPIPSANILESPVTAFGSHTLPSESASARNPQGSRKFVGTPDYLAPESILGIGMDDMAVDWWALGVILYEFLYGIPPFHAETPDRVFDNILSRRIDWDEDVEISPAARDLMERLMCTDPQKRLGAKGADEVKQHPFFEGIDWENVAAGEGPFVPHVADPESTDYFDLRGAAFQEFTEEELRISSTQEFANALQRNSRIIEPTRPPSRLKSSKAEKESADAAVDDFGSFSFKNLPVLKQANDEMIRKMRNDQMPPMAQAIESTIAHSRHRSLSGKAGKSRSNLVSQAHHNAQPVPGHGPPSPSTSVSSQSSVPSRSTAPTSPSTAGPYLHNYATAPHKRRPSEYTMGVSASTSSLVGVSNAIMDRKRSLLAESEIEGSHRKPSRMRTSSLGASSERAPMAVAQSWQDAGSAMPSGGIVMESSFSGGSNAGSLTAGERGPPSDGTRPSVAALSDTSATDSTGTCLIAEDNPIALRMLENILGKIGIRTVSSVRNGAEATRLAMGDVRYSVIFLDLTLPIVSGEDAAKMIKSTRNVNSSTPIVALASYDREDPVDVSHSVFNAVLAKPLNKADIISTLSKISSNGLAASVGPRERRGTFMFPPPTSGLLAMQLSTPPASGSVYAASDATSAGLSSLMLDSKRASASDTDPLSGGSEWGSRRESHAVRTPYEKHAP